MFTLLPEYIGKAWPLFMWAVAIVGEAATDKQKSAAKKVNPKRFCDTGLYKIIRCPYYLGRNGANRHFF